jgi:RimJ/RimL family protein N-acetyltransferase
MSSPATDPVIRTPRLVLRKVRPEQDFAAMHAILSNPRAMAYWSTPPHESEDETRAWLAGMAETPPGAGEDFIIEHGGRAIGKAGFHRFPEIGYILDPAMWGQGLAREALGAVIARVFAAHDLARITADVDPRNAASIRLLEGLGFVETRRASRTWLIAGEWCDSIYFALSREGWLARTA